MHRLSLFLTYWTQQGKRTRFWVRSSGPLVFVNFFLVLDWYFEEIVTAVYVSALAVISAAGLGNKMRKV